MKPSDIEAIIRDYTASLIIPKTKPAKQFMLCSVGLVGAGKTTVTKPLAERLSLVRISGDEIRKLLKEKSFDYTEIVKIGSILTEKYLKEGYSIALDSDCAGRSQPFIIEAEKKYNVIPIWIHVNPPESFILNKLKKFKHTWLFKDSEEAIENYNKRKQLHENLTMPFVYTFDTSRQDISKQIEEAITIIKNKTT